jgi:hypothetical protein
MLSHPVKTSVDLQNPIPSLPNTKQVDQQRMRVPLLDGRTPVLLPPAAKRPVDLSNGN